MLSNFYLAIINFRQNVKIRFRAEVKLNLSRQKFIAKIYCFQFIPFMTYYNCANFDIKIQS